MADSVKTALAKAQAKKLIDEAKFFILMTDKEVNFTGYKSEILKMLTAIISAASGALEIESDALCDMIKDCLKELKK